jgi:hypothetical protein
MNLNPYDDIRQKTLYELWNLGASHAERGIHNPPQFSGVNAEAVIAYRRGWASARRMIG